MRPAFEEGMMIALVGRLRRRTLLASAVCVLSLAGAPGCAELSEWMSFESASDKAAVKAQADAASLWELTLMAGRYGAMLDQAREILRLPEVKAGPMFPTADDSDAAQRKALAAYQVTVTKEFFTDAARACKRKRTPQSVREVACQHQGKAPADLTAPAALDIAALSARNDKVGDMVMPWWGAVCDTAPKPKEGDPPACPME
jgi:hypothetical protein